LNKDNKSPKSDLQSEEAAEAKLVVQKRIADLFSTETNSLNTDDVFLYPSGMSSISHTADIIKHLTTDKKRTVAIFGYVNLEQGAVAKANVV
jgi:cystathionine gamma-synthase